MTPERSRPTDPAEWLARARSNLECAKIGADLAGIYLEDLCFNAQQAAEKAIKAVFIHRRKVFPYIHDLRKLLDLLAADGVTMPDEVREAADLTEYAVAGRYPGLDEPVTKEEYIRALGLAETVYDWAKELIVKR